MSVSAEARALHDQALIIDLHCDMLLASGLIGWDWAKRHRGHPIPGAPLLGHTDIPRLREGNVGCLALGIVSFPFLGPWRRRHVDGLFDRLDEKLTTHAADLELSTTAQAITGARARGKIACFAGLEGVHGLMGKLDQLPRYKERGLVYVGFAHFTRNEALRPMVGWGAGGKRGAGEGLTDFGRDLVDACNELGLVIDVAHANRAALLEICERSKAPVICSHTACTAVHPSPRGLDDEQILAIARTGGVIGLIFVTPFIGSGGAAKIVKHLDHIRGLAGIGACAIGSDWEGFAIYPPELDACDKLPVLTQAMLDARWTPEDVLAVYGGNFLRVLAEIRG